MAQGGEFAFVLDGAALAVGLIAPAENAVLTAVVILPMVMTPLLVILHDRLAPRPAAGAEGLERPEDEGAHVLPVGVGRFGRIVSQPVLARGCRLAILDSDPHMIRAAQGFGFRVFHGDGTRLDILHAAGAHHARPTVVAVDDAEAAMRIAALAREQFPQAAALARAYGRAHALALVRGGDDHVMRETFESALATATAALGRLGGPPETVAEATKGVRRREAERFALQLSGALYAGRQLLPGTAEASRGKPI